MSRTTQARVRMFAGPNGSGKSTLIASLQASGKFKLGIVMNPDLIQAQLLSSQEFEISQLQTSLEMDELEDFARSHPLWARIGQLPVTIYDNKMTLLQESESLAYFISMFCDLIRRKWVESQRSFTFESVMSSRDKIEFLEFAKSKRFRTYLYFICTESHLVNIERVRTRVTEGGHDVPGQKIIDRYQRVLRLLPEAISVSHRSFLFDNSAERHRLVAEFEAGRLVRIVADPPQWLLNHVTV